MFRSLFAIGTFVLVSWIGAITASASVISDVWSTGTVAPSDGAFGTAGSVNGNTLSAEIITESLTATVNLTASNESWFKIANGPPTGSNDQLAPFLENASPLVDLTFSTDVPLTNVDLLFHNVWHATDSSSPNGGHQNYVGNFTVTYEDGTVATNVLPTIRSINNDSPFETDLIGGTLQPTKLDAAFDGGNLLSVSDSSFTPGNGATPGYYWSDPSRSIMSETQGFGIFSFDESPGSITKIEFSWVSNTVTSSTAFIGFAGKVTPASIPEPACWLMLMLAPCFGRRRLR